MSNQTLHMCLVSGGKDSQATAIWCRNNNIEPIYVFNDTKWEDIVTYDFIKDFESKLGKDIIRLSPQLGFTDLAKHKQRFPSTKARFCTEELKVKPMIDFILNHDQDIIIYQGIRWQESTNRAGMEKTDDFFKYYFEPYKITEEGEKKYYTYRKDDIKKWLQRNSCTVIRPIISWSTDQVFEYILSNGFAPNKLYQYGFTRVGCFPCIQCTKDEIAKVEEYRPERIEEIDRLEKEMDSTFFPPDYIPQRFCSKTVVVRNKESGEEKKVKVPTIRDVINYVKRKRYGSGMFTGSHCQNQMLPCE